MLCPSSLGPSSLLRLSWAPVVVCRNLEEVRRSIPETFRKLILNTGDDDRSETKTINVDDVDVCPHYRVYFKDDLAHCQSQQLSNNEKFTHKLTNANRV